MSEDTPIENMINRKTTVKSILTLILLTLVFAITAGYPIWVYSINQIESQSSQIEQLENQIELMNDKIDDTSESISALSEQ